LYRDLGVFEWPNPGELWQGWRDINQILAIVSSKKYDKFVGKRRQHWVCGFLGSDLRRLRERRCATQEKISNALI